MYDYRAMAKCSTQPRKMTDAERFTVPMRSPDMSMYEGPGIVEDEPVFSGTSTNPILKLEVGGKYELRDGETAFITGHGLGPYGPNYPWVYKSMGFEFWVTDEGKSSLCGNTSTDLVKRIG